ncbi:hypothetical protein F4781DRAFT_396526 [Annulohypoxylon bovei var. microspora]|nr:hypothetical protein F4781DRAFT_396526 [Annulohypoxylon bovei var. microspora]
MSTRERAHTTRGGRGRGSRRRRRQIAQANANTTSTTGEIEQRTIDIPAQTNHQPQISYRIGRTTPSHDEHGLRQARDLGNLREAPSILPHDKSSEQPTYDSHSNDDYSTIYAFLNQMNIHSRNHPTPGDLHPHPNQAERHLPISAYDGLGHHTAQQEFDRNFALESWIAQSLYEGPLRVMPDISGPEYLGHQLESRDNNDWSSDTGATGGITPDRCYD